MPVPANAIATAFAIDASSKRAVMANWPPSGIAQSAFAAQPREYPGLHAAISEPASGVAVSVTAPRNSPVQTSVQVSMPGLAVTAPVPVPRRPTEIRRTDSADSDTVASFASELAVNVPVTAAFAVCATYCRVTVHAPPAVSGDGQLLSNTVKPP